MICCYNFTGVITENSPFKAFVIPVLADLAKPEAIFDVETNWNLLGTIAQVVLTLILNMSFRSIAVWCTDRENHKYNSSYQNSMIAKRFVFEFLDCFLPLIYFGWFERNFTLLRQNVISIYIADELRRVVLETLVPYLSHKVPTSSKIESEKKKRSV